MSVIVTGVEEHSIAEQNNIKAGDIVCTINGEEISDILDYRFIITDETLHIVILSGTEKKQIIIKKQEYDDIGLQFQSYLMDNQRSCRNGCVFCFIDQLPEGMRESLYFKDDDFRLSFLFGNYITLTNLPQKDIDRIIKMHISPVNVSVHTTNEDLRVKMMKNKSAGRVLSYLHQLAAGGIAMNTQLVVCKGINDGEELKRSLQDLSALYPALQSVAVVPVGLTKHRQGLFPLESFDKQSASDVIRIIDEFAEGFYQKHGTRLAFAADEFYVKAEKELPGTGYYEEYAQLENGVGLVSLFGSEFQSAVDEYDGTPDSLNKSVATGISAAPYLKSLVDYMNQKWDNMNIEIFPIENDFFGRSIDVAGLITGQDIINQLKGKNLGTELFIPSVMLKHEENIFLDDITVDELSEALNVPVTAVPVDGYEFFSSITKQRNHFS
ncbi:MAG: Fe-S oxidoreductase [Clostridiales bacterium 43-6]|nr:MAG: Fe-S oxidoreductase [Clostridiales bacterium 43-6]